MKLYRTKEGNKLYPVCNWENNQHKMYYFYTKALNARDNDWTQENEDRVQKIANILNTFEAYVVDGMVYATYDNYKVFKDLIGGYDLTH